MVYPSGQSHEVALDDLFFSTTDHKGVIDEANNVFCSMARYPRERLMGAPHNIIRHPAMPGGAFKLVWDQLLAGKPACAYVQNMASDGSAYWVFATIVPIGDRFLSVRSRPCNDQLHSSVSIVYEQVRAIEEQAREEGHRKSEASRIGAEAIEKSVEGLGYPTFEDFMLDLLPAELGTRRAFSPTPPGSEVSDPLHKAITAGAQQVELQLGALTDAMEQAHGVSARLTALAKSTYDTMGKLESVLGEAQDLCEDWDNTDQLVVDALPAVRDKAGQLAQALAPIQQEIETVSMTRRYFRFDIEVARLQNEAIGRYVVAVSRGREDPAVSSKAITSLADALYNLVNTDLGHDISATAQLRQNVDRVAAALRVMHLVVGSWRNLVDTRGMSEVMAEVLPSLDKALRRMAGEVAEISESVGHLVSAIEGFDVDALREQLSAIKGQAEQFAPPADPYAAIAAA